MEKVFVDADGYSEDDYTRSNRKQAICFMCQKGFSYQRHLDRHMLTHRNGKPFVCPVCSKGYSQKDYLKKHMIVHKAYKTFACTECGKRFFRKETLKVHMLTHSGVMGFICPECHQPFRQKHHLEGHILKHSGERRVVCPHCDRNFTYRHHLKAHIMTHSKQKSFTCPASGCEQVFRGKHHLDNHLLTHSTGNKEYPCSYCEKKYTFNHQLERHLEKHNRLKPYICQVCNEGFLDEESLKEHIPVHRGETSFVCTACPQLFISKNILLKHIVYAHNAEVQTNTVKMGSRGIKRNYTCVKDRLEAIALVENGESLRDVAKKCNVTRSALSKWIKHKRSLERTAECSGPSALTRKDNSHAVKLRRAVYDWFLEQRIKGLPMSGPLIASKAVELNAAMDGPADFTASKGWVDHFKSIYGIRMLNITGEKRSADTDAADAYRAKLHLIMQEKDLTPDQVYNADESGLYIRCMPNTTLASKEELNAPGFKADKTRVTILFCSNATGDHKLPLLIIGKSENPRAFSEINRKKLPAVYTYSKKAWMTAKIFEDWVTGQFEPSVKKYLQSKGLPLRAILLVDNAPSHKLSQKTIGIVTIIFLPPNATSLIQPMDQGIIALFKRAYRLYLLRRLVKALNLAAELKKITVLVALKLSAKAWDDIKSETLAKCWKPIGLHIQKPDPPTTRCIQNVEKQLEEEIINAAKEVQGLGTLNPEEIVEWCESDPQDLCDETAEDEYQFPNPDRVLETDPGISISHEEGAAILDRALLYAEQCAEYAPYLEHLTTLRDMAAKRVQQ